MRSPASPSDLVLANAMVAIAAILLTGSLLGNLMRRLRQPPVIGEIFAGIILGKSALGLLPGHLTDRLFPANIRSMLLAVAQIGLLLFIYLIGWEFEKSLLRRRRAAAGAVSSLSVAVAFGLGSVLGLVLYARHSHVHGDTISRTAFVLFIGAAMSITAFPVLARILQDNGLMHTKVGALALASAAIDDVLAWCMLALVSATVTASSPFRLLQIVAFGCVYVAVMFMVIRPLLARMVLALANGRASIYLPPILASGVFLSAYATTWIGIHAIFGAFLFGFIMPRQPADLLQTRLRRPLDAVCALLMPVFFIVTGLAVDIGSLSARNYAELAAIILVACAGKFIGVGLSARAFGLSWNEVGVLGVLMNTRGLTELIVLNAGLQLGVLDTTMFTMMVIMALVTTAAAGPLLPRLMRGSPGAVAVPAQPSGRPTAGAETTGPT